MSTTRPLMGRLFDPQFASIAGYDSFVQIQFEDIEQFVRMKADPFYKTTITPDHENFADTRKSTYESMAWLHKCTG